MSDNPTIDPTSDSGQLSRDADRSRPLERVAFVEGMLLGAEATRAEQEYHRRRLTRHNYWNCGCGTIAGMGVYLDPASVAQATSQPAQLGVPTRLIVNAGLGIDGLGREVLIPEPYCIDLNAWIQTFVGKQASLAAALSDAVSGQKTLFVYLMARQEARGSNLTPVMAREVNMGTDAVEFGRVLDGFALELVLDDAQGESDADWVSGLGPWKNALNSGLWDPASALNAFGLPEDEARRRRLLINAYTTLPHPPEDDADPSALARWANFPLCNLRIHLDATSSGVRLELNAQRVTVNNLVRPFVRTAVHSLISAPTV